MTIKGHDLDVYESYLRANHSEDIDNISTGAKLPYELIIDYRELEMYNVELADLLIDKSDDIIYNFQIAFRNLNRQSHNLLELSNDEICNIRFKNITTITPIRELTAENVGKLIQTTGVISNYTINHQVAIKLAVFECKSCMRLHEVKQSQGDKLVYPDLCGECGGRNFKLLEGESSFINQKKLILTEPIDQLNGKNRPQSIEAIITGEREFIEKINNSAGKKINIIGKVVSWKDNDNWRTGLIINNIWNNEDKSINLSDDDITYFKQLNKEYGDLIIDELIKSFAPYVIYPNPIKLALLCQRVGAGEVGENRKNINILIVGDRGIGKTTLANKTTELYPIYKKSSGTGASGVGLIGAVDRDSINGGWTYEAGAIILADGGLIVIDEFDKILYEDQSKVNDLLEDGIADIDKATVHISVSADVRALALANPRQSKFNLYEDIRKQIEIDDSTFDRFDGIFVLTTGEFNNEYHQNIRKSKYDSYKNNVLEKESDENLLSKEMLIKYLFYVESEFNPIFDDESEKQGLKYHDIIYQSEFEGQRQSDSLDRFAGAIAKLRQHKTITSDDVDKAFELIKYMADKLNYEI